MAPSNTDQVAVPETLLKKRRVNEKTREEKLAKAAEAKKVSFSFNWWGEGRGSEPKALP
jgi:hypothetical protein